MLSKIRAELKASIDHNPKEDSKFYKPGQTHKSYGIRTPKVRKIAKKYFYGIKSLEKEKIFNLCEELLKSNYTEESTIAFSWTYELRKRYQQSDFKTFQYWLEKYINNWGSCDDFCTHTLGEFLLQFPQFLSKLTVWARSKNRWLRRATAVSLIYPNRKNKYIDNSFKIANILLKNQDDLVQKGYGWMLKEISELYPIKVYNFVMKNKTKMPRTALRYAIEKLPENLKKQAMEKDL